MHLGPTLGGSFWPRQYLTYPGAKSGEKSMAFTQKVLGKGHATARVLLRNGRIYHLFSRLVCRAIGREHLRNRREHSVEHMRTKLATLDLSLGTSITGISKPKMRRLPTFVKSWALPGSY